MVTRRRIAKTGFTPFAGLESRTPSAKLSVIAALDARPPMRSDWKIYAGTTTRARRPLLHRSRWVARKVAASAAHWLRTVWLTAFPPEHPDGTPGPVPPLSAAAALRQGALLYEIDGEPVSSRRIA
jgi:hypothetical protein